MKVKLWISLVLAFLAFVFITQNSETANVRFLAWSVEMSLVLLVFFMLGSGVIIGWLLSSYMRYSMKKGKEHQFEGKGAEDAVPPAPNDGTNQQEVIKTEINEKKENDE